jgi:hypothetical protein
VTKTQHVSLRRIDTSDLELPQSEDE